MKILYISESSAELLSPGSNRARATIKYLRQNSFDVYDFDISKKYTATHSNLKILENGNGVLSLLKQSIRTLDGRVFSTFFIKQLASLFKIRHRRFDVIYISYKPPMALFLGVIAKLFFRAKLVIEYRDLASLFQNKPKILPLHLVDIMIDRLILCFSSRVVVVSPTQAKILREKFSVEALIVLNGFDMESGHGGLESLREKNWITYVGTLSSRRNLSGLNHLQSLENYRLNVLSSCDPFLYDPPVGLQIDHLEVMPRLTMMSFIHRSSYLLLIEGLDEASYANIPSKVFEYISTRNTILFIGSEFSDVYQLLLQYGNFIHLDGKTAIDAKLSPYEDILDFSRLVQLEKLKGMLRAIH